MGEQNFRQFEYNGVAFGLVIPKLNNSPLPCVPVHIPQVSQVTNRPDQYQRSCHGKQNDGCDLLHISQEH